MEGRKREKKEKPMNRLPVPVTHPGIWHHRQCRYPNNIRKENLPQVKGASAFHELRCLTSWSEKSTVTLLKSAHFDSLPRQRSWQALWHCLPEDAQQITIFSALPSSAIDGVRALSHGTAEGTDHLSHSKNQWLCYCRSTASENTTRSRETAAFPSWNEERGDSYNTNLKSLKQTVDMVTFPILGW